MKYGIYLLLIPLFLLPLNTYPLDLDHMLSKGPLITINRDKRGKFDSITAYAKVAAPFHYVWDTVLNIEDYGRYMPRLVKSRIVSRNRTNSEIIAEFEVRTFITNKNYALRYVMDKKSRTIDVSHHSGALKGSQWLWQFQIRERATVIICTGGSKNLSSFIKAIDDRTQTLTIGINISSMLANLRYIKKRSESLYRDNTGKSNGPK